MFRRLIAPTLIPLALVAAACGGSDDDTDFATVPPPVPAPTSAAPATTDAPTTTTADAPTTNEAPALSTTATEAPPTTIVAADVVGLSPDGPWTLVDSAPGVDSPGLVYELMPKLWAFLPTEESEDDGTLFVPAPDDIPIIEAYLRARLVYFQAITSDPIDLEHPGWATEYLDGGQSYFDSLQARQAEGQVADLDVGVVLRPRVIGDGRTEAGAIVFDCILDGGVFKLPNGELAPGSTPGIVPFPFAASVVEGDTRWIVERDARQPGACG